MQDGNKHGFHLKNDIKHSLKQECPLYTRVYGAKERRATFLVTSPVFMTSLASLMSKTFTKMFSSILTVNLNLLKLFQIHFVSSKLGATEFFPLVSV